VSGQILVSYPLSLISLLLLKIFSMDTHYNMASLQNGFGSPGYRNNWSIEEALLSRFYGEISSSLAPSRIL